MTNTYEIKDGERVAEVVWHNTQCTREQRSNNNGHRSLCIWLTGLSGSGKSTLANALEAKLLKEEFHTYILDGDNVRHGLNKDLGMSPDDRRENIRRVGEVAKLMVDAGLITIAAFISPSNEDRKNVRDLLGADFCEVYVSTDLAVCEQRDPKGMYKRARAGEIKDFTGIDAPYDVPSNPECIINTKGKTVDECIQPIMDYIIKYCC